MLTSHFATSTSLFLSVQVTVVSDSGVVVTWSDATDGPAPAGYTIRLRTDQHPQYQVGAQETQQSTLVKHFNHSLFFLSSSKRWLKERKLYKVDFTHELTIFDNECIPNVSTSCLSPAVG